MRFYTEFCRALAVRPIPALVALYWHLTRRRVRAKNQLRKITARSRYVYEIWVKNVEALDKVLSDAAPEMNEWNHKPLVSIFLHIAHDSDAADVEAAVNSVMAQCYPFWELLLVVGPGAPRPAIVPDGRIRFVAETPRTDVEALDAALEVAQGSYFLPLARGGRLSPAAVFFLVQCLQIHPHASVIYGDQDELRGRRRRSRPWFKPEWNSELFLAQDYLSDACLINAQCARTAIAKFPMKTEGAPIYSLILSIVLENDDIIHLQKIVVHISNISRADNQAARVAAVARHVRALGGKAGAGPFGSVKVSWPLPPTRPKVSIIIPTRDRISLLKACVESIIQNTDYPSYEIVIVDNDSAEKETIRYFEEISKIDNLNILKFSGDFNFSAMNNYAVRMSSSKYICLLNNDTEIMAPNWLDELMRYAVRKDVGAVGAKLLYPDGSVQHAGVVLGLGGAAGHAHRNLSNDDRGYFGQAHFAHFVSAVTAACLVVAKEKFEVVGGLDAEGFKVAFNDVDFCLKLERAGWRNVYAPAAVLVHHESKSRGKDQSPQNIDRYLKELNLLQRRWNTASYRDPLHHPHLDPASETYVIKC